MARALSCWPYIENCRPLYRYGDRPGGRGALSIWGGLSSPRRARYIISGEHQIATARPDLTRLEGVGAYLETRVVIGIVVTSFPSLTPTPFLYGPWGVGDDIRLILCPG